MPSSNGMISKADAEYYAESDCEGMTESFFSSRLKKQANRRTDINIQILQIDQQWLVKP